MITADDVERWARALGVWLDVRGWTENALTAHKERVKAGWTISAEARGLVIRFWPTPHRDITILRCEAPIAIDPLTAALLLAGHARKLRVDVGECPACRARGSKRGPAMWDWAWRRFGSTAGWYSTGMDGADPLPGLRTRGGWTSAWLPSETYKQRLVASRPCPACSVDGTPTGRHTLTWEAAIIAAMPREDAGAPRVYEQARASGVEAVALREALGAKSVMSRVAPGDADTREALRAMAHTIAGPEHIAVTHDWCESGKALSDFNGEPQGGLGEIVAAWLRSELDHYVHQLRHTLDEITAAATSQQQSAAAPAA